LKLFLLGAGKPAHGYKPSALKNISSAITVLDWKIHSFESVVNANDIYFLGGYHIDEVVEKYPNLNFSIIPDWKNKNILNTLFNAPLFTSDTIVSYSDTIFRKNIIENLVSKTVDMVYAVDSLWKDRFTTRTLDDINKAETIKVNDKYIEFTGLIYFSRKAMNIISRLTAEKVGSNLLDLISYLEKEGLSSKAFDIKGQWAEFNSPDDIAKFILGTKAETLARLEPLVQKSYIGKQVTFTSSEWKIASNEIIEKIQKNFQNSNLVVRSSSKNEDNWDSSNAGGFKSILDINILNQNDIIKAIDEVIFSYGDSNINENQILVQSFLKEVDLSGVIFTSGLEFGSPYYRINFDDTTQSTESVTSGTHHGNLRTVIISRLQINDLNKIEPKLVSVLEAVRELEELLSFNKLDIEFAIDKNGTVHIFQVRPITVNHSDYDLDIQEIKTNITNAKQTFLEQQKPNPFLFGNKTILANMSDWNPAEIIGTRPKPLAFSLYRQIITNDIWAQQRAEFGYCDIRPHPLIVSLCGQPYVDTRASFNSFIPNDLTRALKLKLANAYTELLSQNPQLHDKIEFDIAYTIWTPNFISNAMKRLKNHSITKQEFQELENSLKNITKNAFTRLNNDINSINILEERRKKVLSSSLSYLDQAFILLDDCKKYGTLAFSHAARAGFVSTTFLNSLVENNLFTQERKHEFLMSFKTVAGNFKEVKYLYSINKLSLKKITQEYGHLRPGTYELGAKAYWENPQLYLVSEDLVKPKELQKFILTTTEKNSFEKVLLNLGADISAEELLNYFAKATQAREFVKFEFTKNLSKALDLIIKAGKELGIKRKKLSFLEYSDLEQLKLNVLSLKDIKKNIKKRKKKFLITEAIELPPLIQDISNFYCFERHSSEPNFVTSKIVQAIIYRFNVEDETSMHEKIVMIPQADPGYDWLFSYKIAGLITLHGGANSHMAIRAAEIGLPSAIGVGEKLFEKIAMMKRVELNCSNRLIREIV
jgi:choline kinase